MAEMKPGSCTSIVLPFPSNNVFFILLNLLFLQKYKSGIFHITGHVHYAAIALPKGATVLTIHDLVFLTSYKGLRKKVMKFLFLDLPVRRVGLITTVSEKTKLEILEHTNCDPHKIIVIENPLDPSLLLCKNVFNTSKPVLLFLGTKQNKNLENTIPALYELNVKLRIIGELTVGQENLLRKFSIDYDAVKNLGDEALRQEYYACDGVLFPSLYEGFGMPVIEAFASGKPVITSSISPMVDVAKDAAFYVDPDSIISIRAGIKQMLFNEHMREQNVIKGLALAENYKVSKILQAYQSIWSTMDNPKRHI